MFRKLEIECVYKMSVGLYCPAKTVHWELSSFCGILSVMTLETTGLEVKSVRSI